MWANASAGEKWAAEAVRLARAADDGYALGEALSAQALIAIFSGRPDEARALGDQVIALAQSRRDWWMLAMTDTSMALSDLASGHPETAQTRIVRATEAAGRSGNPFVIAFNAGTRGQMSGLAGHPGEAREWIGKAITVYDEMGDRRFGLISRSDLAHALRRGGEMAEAEVLYRETLRAWQHAGSRGAIANQLESFAFIAVARGEPVRGAKLLGAAEFVRETAGAKMLPHERTEYAAALAVLHEHLDTDAVDKAWSHGRTLTIDEAVALAVAP